MKLIKSILRIWWSVWTEYEWWWVL